MSKEKNTNVLFARSYECGSGAGMKHIGFYMDGLSLMVNGNPVGMSYTPEAGLRLTLGSNGSWETAEKKEIGNE